MTKNRYLLTATGLLLGSVVLAGCTAVAESSAPSTATSIETVESSQGGLAAQAVLDANENSTTVNDDEWDATTSVAISLSSPTATDGVTVDGDTVTITAAGTYTLSGDLDGQVVVAAPDDAVVALVLDNATISSSTTAAIAVTSADDVVISLTGDNAVSDTSSYASDADVNAAIFSEADLTISGDGTLTVNANGNDGITSEDDLVILSGTLAINAVDDALRGKDSLVVKGGAIRATAGGDALKSDNGEDATRGYVWIDGGTIALTASDDGIDALTDVVQTGGDVSIAATDDGVHGDTLVVLDGDGTLDITSSYEGIEAPAITVASGDVQVTSSDDGLNASGNAASTGEGGGMSDTGELITISGGTTVINADGDGFDSNGSAVITAGTLIVNGPTNDGNGALDVNGTLTVSGGTVLAVGSAGMAVSPTDGTQSWISALASGASGDVVQLLDSSGTVVYEFTATKSFSSVVFSSAVLADGANYSVTVGGSSAVTVTEGTATAGMAGGQGGPGGGQRP